MPPTQYHEYGFTLYSNGAIIWDHAERAHRVLQYGRPGERLANSYFDACRMLEDDGGRMLRFPVTSRPRPEPLTQADVERIVIDTFEAKIIPAITSALWRQRQVDGI